MAKSISLNINGNWLTLPKCYYELGQMDENRTYRMASGKTKIVVVGTRKTITASFEYIPSADLVAINNAIKTNPLISVRFHDVDGSMKAETFIMSPISPTVFKYKTINGADVPVWTDVTITGEGQVIS